MNPIWQWLIAHTTGMALLRQCPRCHHRQLAPREELRETVRCTRCGADIPPKAGAGDRMNR